MKVYYALVYNPQDESILTNNVSHTLPTLCMDPSLRDILERLFPLLKETIGAEFDVIRLCEGCEVPKHPVCICDYKLQIVEVVGACAPTETPGYVWVPQAESASIGVDPENAAVSKFLQS